MIRKEGTSEGWKVPRVAAFKNAIFHQYCAIVCAARALAACGGELVPNNDIIVTNKRNERGDSVIFATLLDVH